uniref:Putative site-specific DNA endonuclease n=1 Tax=Astrephomene gubernaculifera TaxID=47775 RepID=A0A7R6ULT2_9CHLO|nr:putative site-specific DNA endonuclease [Astrephomene gubernaculifera]BCA78194.1 putative site-specific DNA endonuclease [Astrephomene gubernaculifera]
MDLAANRWVEFVNASASKWNHVICKITGESPSRRSFILWYCKNHPDDGEHTFVKDNAKLKEFCEKYSVDNKKGLSQEEIDILIAQYPGQPFYASRMDHYLNPANKKGETRTYCCVAGMIKIRKQRGIDVFKKLLADRGKHYNTTYTPLFADSEYKGKLKKHPFKCEAHNQTLYYSLQDLNYNTSCPCPQCRQDPKHKNVCVDIVKKRNAGRPAQVTRHAMRVKEKYNNACALSSSTFNLQHHHLDGRDFYEDTADSWDVNGICLCGTIHRDYHNNFLKKKV